MRRKGFGVPLGRFFLIGLFMKTRVLRQTFLDFFGARDHLVLPSSPLVPIDDASLLFVNSGMVPFKNYFLQRATPPSTRLSTCQASFRASGKHNDFSQVGKTFRHHTLFEMLGNFSFGAYGKREAIAHAWSFLTEVLKLPKDRLLVTFYAEDLETAALWKEIANLPTERILPISTSDNFWSMGDTGPCGPCTEIFYILRPDLSDEAPLDDRAVEIWNLVFMTYEQHADGSRTLLPTPCVDTGMGLERIASIVQGVHDNYRTDAFRILIDALAKALPEAPEDPCGFFPLRVLADHVRALCFLVAEGLRPERAGRGYVLRRLIRRMACQMRDMRLDLLQQTDLIARGVAAVQEEMGGVYTNLLQAPILETFLEESALVQETLARGMPLLLSSLTNLKTGDTLDGSVAFSLYDTHGFPVDVIEDVIAQRGINLDLEGFNASMERQKTQARNARSSATQDVSDDVDASSFPETVFVGYGSLTHAGRVLGLFNDQGQAVEALQEGESGQFVSDETPFYAESGGQLWDQGVVESDDGRFHVLQVQKQDKRFVHIGTMEKGRLTRGGSVKMHVDAERRTGLCAHHTAAHLLQSALRLVLGGHASQKGSLVAHDRVRFDFSHPKPLTSEELKRMEEWINARIRANAPVQTDLLSYKEAVAAGALSLAGEAYGAEVRVLSVLEGETCMSKELCGGTHARRTGDLGVFLFTGGSALASGVRRVEAVVGAAALAHIQAERAVLEQLTRTLNVKSDRLFETVCAFRAGQEAAEKEAADAKRTLLIHSTRDALETVGNVHVAKMALGTAPYFESVLKALRTQKKGVLVLIERESPASFAIALSSDSTADVAALFKGFAAQIGGKGGGRGPVVFGGGANVQKLSEAVAWLNEKLK